jgi:hypothetical protein
MTINVNLQEIDIKGGITKKTNELLISDAVKSIQVVPLQTNSQSLLGGSIANITATANNVFIHAYANNKVFRFAKDGTFLNSIGEVGEGPMEYTRISLFFVDDKEKELGIVSTLSVQMYRYDGSYSRTATRWNIDSFSYAAIDRCFKYNNDYYLTAAGSIMRPMSNAKDSLWAVLRVDSNFTIQQRYYNPEALGREEELLRNRATPEKMGWTNYLNVGFTTVDFYDNKLTAQYYGVDTLYRMKSPKEGFEPAYSLQLGERPSYELSRRWIKERKFFDYLWVKDFYETKDYLYFTAYKSDNIYNIRYDKHTGGIESVCRKGKLFEQKLGPFIYRRIDVPFILKNDICGGGDFQVDYKCGGRYWVSVIDPAKASDIDIEALKKEQVKDEVAKQQLIEALENAKEDDNPILLVATLK